VATTITICDTCERADKMPSNDGRKDGARLAELIENAARRVAAVRTRRHACLMGCGKGCNVVLQAEGKLTYVLGGFEPTAGKACAIVEYARLHAQSETGQVAFRSWPQDIKGHFVSRIPQLDPPAP